jgi:hypothetical protein
VSPSRLLIIDDEPSIVAALERIGKSCGFATTSTTTAETFKENICRCSNCRRGIQENLSRRVKLPAQNYRRFYGRPWM